MLRMDARVPVRAGRGDGGGAEAALLREGVDFVAAPGHPVGCACCVERSPVAVALATLFQRRARGEVPFFRAVVVVGGTEAAVREAVMTDPLVTSRFRWEG